MHVNTSGGVGVHMHVNTSGGCRGAHAREHIWGCRGAHAREHIWGCRGAHAREHIWGCTEAAWTQCAHGSPWSSGSPQDTSFVPVSVICATLCVWTSLHVQSHMPRTQGTHAHAVCRASPALEVSGEHGGLPPQAGGVLVQTAVQVQGHVGALVAHAQPHMGTSEHTHTARRRPATEAHLCTGFSSNDCRHQQLNADPCTGPSGTLTVVSTPSAPTETGVSL
jgi:hypothetical protein